MLGYPGAGKSNFARHLAEEIKAVRFNGDSMRHGMFDEEEKRRDPGNNSMVFGAMDYSSSEVLKSGYSVIYDASHNRKVDRLSAQNLASPFGITPVIIWLKVPLEIAKDRAFNRERSVDQPSISEKRFDELVNSIEIPEANEKVILIDGTKPFNEQMESFNSQLNVLS